MGGNILSLEKEFELPFSKKNEKPEFKNIEPHEKYTLSKVDYH